MEDQKKKQFTQKEGNHKENGARISVRPGNFNPPAERGEDKPRADRQAAPAREGDAPREGGAPRGDRHGRGGRNRRGRDNRHRDRRENGAEEQPIKQAEAAAQARPAEAGKQQKKQHENRGDNRGDNRNENRGDNRNNNKQNNNRPRHNEQRQKPAAPVQNRSSELSETLKKELDAEFEGSLSSLRRTESRAAESVADTEEFAVDIATAGYLIEDIPCGFPAPNGKAVEVIGVRFRRAGKVYFFSPEGEKFRIGEAAIVDTARGPEFGEVVMLNRRIAEKDVIQPLRSVLRRATEQDIAHDAENHAKEAEALKICAEKIAAHKLDMKLVEAQYAFDNSKLLFYFTSDGRVDFRELVRDLAGVFRTRIELRQIGIRDESRLIGGLGMCGRPFCCTTFLSDFGQVSVKMAKEQGLSINTSKISGCCGRLMCCLRYEHETYSAEAALTPQKDARVETPDGIGTVVEATPLAGTVKVRLNKAPEEAPVTFHRDQVTVQGKCCEAKPREAEAVIAEEPVGEDDAEA